VKSGPYPLALFWDLLELKKVVPNWKKEVMEARDMLMKFLTSSLVSSAYCHPL
jgi:hypothetical protein